MQSHLIEIFSSFQGEGPSLGQAMTFLRFQDCALSCNYCDTPASFEKQERFRIETPPGSAHWEWHSNPVSPETLTALLSAYKDPVLSLTGGEPLQQVDFLSSWLPSLQGRWKILLESNGVLPAALARIIDWIDIVSMDFKLPSVSGMKPYWREHEEFLKIARQKDLYVKVVVSHSTALEDLQKALALVKTHAPKIPFILQPVTPTGEVRETINAAHLRQLYELSREQLDDVRVIPQMHVILGLL